jgi:hypothetical protein
LKSTFCDPKRLAKWLVATAAIATLSFLLWYADDLASALSSFVVIPWVISPALLAGLFVRRADTVPLAWMLAVVELAAVGSTAAVWTYLMIYNDAQNGIAMLLFPVVQLIAVLVAVLLIVLGYSFWEKRRLSD